VFSYALVSKSIAATKPLSTNPDYRSTNRHKSAQLFLVLAARILGSVKSRHSMIVLRRRLICCLGSIAIISRFFLLCGSLFTGSSSSFCVTLLHCYCVIEGAWILSLGCVVSHIIFDDDNRRMSLSVLIGPKFKPILIQS
jgi:hypothetical protein